jgi:hypothetical protein
VRAVCQFRSNDHYRRGDFITGLQAAGYSIHADLSDPRPGDLLLIWNRYGSFDATARRFEKAGAGVLVVENGFIRLPDETGWQHYAISRGQHHHGGAPLDLSKLANLPKALPWRNAGEHILVCGQRGIGSQMMASPPKWAERVGAKLKGLTDRNVIVRPHPGKGEGSIPLIADLAEAHCCVVWSSCAGLQALLAGIPVFYGAPRWIAQESALPLSGANIEQPYLGDRSRGLAAAASNQWSLAQIRAGEPFKVLAQCA